MHVDVPVEVAPDADVIVRGVTLANPDAACADLHTQTLFAPPGMRSAMLLLDLAPLVDDLRAAGIGQLAVRIELLVDGAPVAETFAWERVADGLERFRQDALPEGIELDLPDEVREGLEGRAVSVRITSDLQTALRNRRDATMWDGTMTLPIRLAQAWDELRPREPAPALR